MNEERIEVSVKILRKKKIFLGGGGGGGGGEGGRVVLGGVRVDVTEVTEVKFL